MINAQVLAEKFCMGENIYDVDEATWQRAFQLIDSNPDAAFVGDRVHSLWIESGGHLRRKIRDDALILRVLKRALPGYVGPTLTLYRGECQFLFKSNQIGFCWTPNLSVAECFARGLNALESGGVLLRATAPTTAVLAAPNDHSANYLGEYEYTCDPTQLQALVVLREYPRP